MYLHKIYPRIGPKGQVLPKYKNLEDMNEHKLLHPAPLFEV